MRDTGPRFHVFSDYAWADAHLWPAFESALARFAAGESNDHPASHEAMGAKKNFLSAELTATSGMIRESYIREDRPGIFLELASVTLTPDGILQFVRKNGLLSGECSWAPKATPGIDSFSAWIESIVVLRRALSLVGGLERPEKLASCIEQAGRTFIYNATDIWNGSFVRFAGCSSEKPAGPVDADEMRLGVARQVIKTQVNSYLRGNIQPEIDHLLRFTLEPKTLLDLAWIQLATALHDGRSFSQCEHCERFFESGKASRADRVYCSRKCKLNAYRKRARDARREILEEFDSQVTAKLSISNERIRKTGRGKRPKKTH